MASDRRLDFVNKWSRHAVETEDPFDRFFCLWIALTVSAQVWLNKCGWTVEKETDAGRIKCFFTRNAEAIRKAVSEHVDIMQCLAKRQGTRYKNPIIDTGKPRLRQHFSDLSQHYISGAPLQAGDHAEYLAELLNAIRNNVFHGEKIYDDRDDLELLSMVNPIIESVMKNIALTR